MNQIIELTQPMNGAVTHPPENYQLGDYYMVDLYLGDPLSVRIFRPLHDRCLDFIQKYRFETDPQWLSGQMVAAFQQSNPYWKMLAAVDANGKIVAHLIANIEPYQSFGNTAFILQWENDPGVREPLIARTGKLLIEEWVRRLRIKNILLVTTDSKHGRLFRRYGFEPFRVILRQEMKYDPNN